ncbi:MAG: cytochrome c oxidase assembly protein [Segniliparus sp.]|uniref:cytochrome c oxidase assembly protein n=1 Tax=Segniliparus sp. TaxID=2804064 RepID=UPI003F302160
MLGTDIATTPLTAASALAAWRLDVPVLVVAIALGLGYWRSARGGGTARLRVASFFCGLAVWVGTAASFLGVYADSLFWVRSLQFTLLLFLVPFLLALGTPLAVLRGGLGEAGRARFDAALSSAPARFLTYPLTTAIAILALPWLVFTTPWYSALLERRTVDEATGLLVVLIGFGYFYSRLQADPTPKKYPQLVTLLLTVTEVVGDGALGLVLAMGDIVASEHYAARAWGPSLRMDQVVGAGVLWILGDVLGIPFILAVMRSFRVEERVIEEQTDAALDRIEAAQVEGAALPEATGQLEATGPQAASGLWWENDPQLRDRFRR